MLSCISTLKVSYPFKPFSNPLLDSELKCNFKLNVAASFTTVNSSSSNEETLSVEKASSAGNFQNDFEPFKLNRRTFSSYFPFSLLSTSITTALSPLKSNASSLLPKKTNLSIEEIKDIIANDIKDGEYFVTGKLTREIYLENCRFKDPTNDTTGVEKYLTALSFLFDPSNSKQELVSIEVISPNQIFATWTLGGFLKFPWRPRVVPFEGSTTYTINDQGLIELHDEKWSISPFTALIETFTPTFGST